jgi:exopolysaccharide production protein ExoY
MKYQNFETLVSFCPADNLTIPVFSNNINQITGSLDRKKSYFIVKRVFDFIVSLTLILLLSPFLLIIYLIVSTMTKESGIFKQIRIGYYGNEFTIYKFRSMINKKNCREYNNFLEDCELKGIFVKAEDDPRIYKFGKFLRKTSIDELPQLFNVLIGNMSLVGPRPVLPFIVNPYPEIKRVRSLIKPGMTGMWQISARDNNLSILQMINYDSEYINNCSLMTDLKILLKTFGVVIKCKGAV